MNYHNVSQMYSKYITFAFIVAEYATEYFQDSVFSTQPYILPNHECWPEATAKGSVCVFLCAGAVLQNRGGSPWGGTDEAVFYTLTQNVHIY